MEQFFKSIQDVKAKYRGPGFRCNFCNKDFTYDNSKGGLYILGFFVCPNCLCNAEKFISEYNVKRYVQYRAGIDETFRDFIKRVQILEL